MFRTKNNRTTVFLALLNPVSKNWGQPPTWIWGGLASPLRSKKTCGESRTTPNSLQHRPKTESNKTQKQGNMLFDFLFCLVFEHMFWAFQVFNHSQMAKFDSRTYPNTFWIIFGASKLFTKYGPLTPRTYHKNTSKIQENDGRILQQYYLFILYLLKGGYDFLEIPKIQKMICRQDQDSTPNQNQSTSIDTFSKLCLI